MDLRDAVRGILWNDWEARPRAPWRLLAGTLLALVVVVALVLVVQPVLAVLRGAGLLVGLPPVVASAANVLVLAAGVTAGLLLATVYLDRRPLADLGLGFDRAWWVDLGAGLALGAGLMTAIFLTLAVAGWVRVSTADHAGPALALALAAGAVTMVAVGVYEELAFRGYYLVNLAEGLRWLPGVDPRRATLLAAAVTSLAFGLLHANNPSATPTIGLFLSLYGAYLAAAYLLTGDLALPVGFHVAWNYVQGFVYGFPVSGLDPAASLVRTEPTGPELLSGGAFGPEASLVGIAWVALSVPVLWWWARRRGTVAYPWAAAEPVLRT